jgi:hypothetical protein
MLTTVNTSNIKSLPTGQNLVDLLHNFDSDRVYECSVVQIQDPEYDADTDVKSQFWNKFISESLIL